jgi:gliding-associated putative ABC transporter substrate-binding component GldG
VSPRRNLLFNATLQMVLVVAICVLANTVSALHFWRVDLTRDRIHSLDEASKRVVAGTDRPLVVKVFMTRGLEAPYNNHEQVVRDKLEEFQAYSGGRMQLRVVDPSTDPELVKEAQKYGLTPLEYTVKREDRSELRRVWMGAVLLYGERTDVLPALTNLASLEYDLASSIHRLRTKREDIKTVAWSTGNGEPEPETAEGPVRTLISALSQKYVIRSVRLGGPGLLSEDVDALLVIGPLTPLSDRALYQVDQFVARGGAAGVFVTHHRPDMRTLRSSRVSGGIEPLLGHWGVQVDRNVVLDRVQNGAMRFPVRVGKQTGMRDISFPLIPRASELSRTSPLTAGLDGMLFPFASSLTLPEALEPGVTREVLATSSPASGSVQALKSIDPGQLTQVLPDEKRGPFPLAVSLVGAFRSFYETRGTPPADATIPDEQDGLGPDAAPIIEGAPTRLVVAGSADFIANNQAFMLNLVDWLVQDEALIGIRSKLATVPQMAPTTPGARVAWRTLNLALTPVLLLAVGAVRQVWRRGSAA